MSLKLKLRWLGKGMTYLVVGLFGLLAAALLLLQTPWAQQRVARLLSTQLDQTLQGRVLVSLDGSLTPFGFSGLSASVFPQDGAHQSEPLATITDLKANWNLAALVGSLTSSGPLTLSIDDIALKRLFVDLRSDANGDLELARAVTPVPSEPSPESEGPAPIIRVGSFDVEQIRVVLPNTADAASTGNGARQEAIIERVNADLLYSESLLVNLSLPHMSVPLPERSSQFRGRLNAWLYLSESAIPTAQASLTGNLQDLAVDVGGAYHDDRWRANLQLGGSEADWNSAAVGWAPAGPLNVVVSANGDLESARAKADIVGDPSVVTVDTRVEFSPLAARGTLTGTRVQPELLAIGAPSGNLNFKADFSGQGEPLRANASIAVRSSSLGEQAVPDFDLDAQIADSTRVDFQLRARDGSALELDGEVNTTSTGVSFAIEGGAQRLPATPGIQQLQVIQLRNFKLDAKGTWQNEPPRLAATLRLDVDRLQATTLGLYAADLSVNLSTDGPLAEPTLNGTASFRTLAFDQMRLTQFRMRARSLGNGASNIRASTVVRLAKDAPLRQVTTRATLASLSPFDARSIELRVSGAEQTLNTSIAQVRLGDSITVDGLRIDGVGELEGSAEIDGGSVDTNVRAKNLDLPALSSLFQPLIPELSGLISADVALRTNGNRLESGHLYARATDAGLASARVDQLATSLVLRNDELSGSAEVRRARSLLRLDTRNMDLGSLRALATATDMTSPVLRSVRGYAVLTARAHLADFPELEQALGDLQANGFIRASLAIHQEERVPLTISSIVRLSNFDIRQLKPSPTGDEGSSDEAVAVLVDSRSKLEATSSEEIWSVQQLTADWATRYDGQSGNWSNSVLVRNASNPNPILGASFATRLPLATLSKLDSEMLKTVPLWGSVNIPTTRLASLPLASFVPTGLDANVGAEITVTGNFASPTAVASLRVDDLRVASLEESFPISVSVDANASTAAVDATVEIEHENRAVAEATVKGVPQNNDWEVAASVNDMPLGCFPFLRDYGIKGVLSGDLNLQHTSDAPQRLTAKLRATDVEAYGEQMPLLSLTANLDKGDGQAQVLLKQSQGRAQLQLFAVSPSGQLTDYRPTKLRLVSESFQIRPLMAAAPAAVNDLSGLLDGAVEVDFQAGATEADGQIRLREGLVLLPALGKQVRDIEITARARPGQLDVTTIEAAVDRGRLSGTGRVQYAPGGEFLAQAELRLPEDNPLPISNKGRDVAEASGRIDISARSAGPDDEVKVVVSVPELDVYFDALGVDTVMDAESPDFVSLGYHAPDGRFISYENREEKAVTAEGNPTIITINLGDDVWLHQGTSTFAAIRGEVTAELGNDTSLTGSLDLAEGRIDIQGRVFDIRPGTVSFRGLSPPNPDVIAEAAWPAPSGHTIVAMYRGSVQSGEITLRSEPALSYGEILNVLLFGDPQGESDSEGSPGASSVAASVASAGLSRSLTSLTNLDIQANIETSVDGTARPELGVRLSPRLAVEVAYNVQPVTTLSEPPDNAFVSFDWRLSSSWSLESTFGDKGSAAADISWKYRY